jgi:diacylglycerol kinase family enzyme
MSSDSPLFIVQNTGSGSRNAVETETTIRSILTQAGRRYDILRSDHAQQLPELAQRAVRLAQQHQGIVVAVGGDGTINTVVQAVLESGCPLGVLPQGTFNYFGRTHHIPADTAEATRALLSAAVQPVQVGLLNDRVFLINASLGLYPKILEDREVYKRQFGRRRLVAIWAAMMTLLRYHRNVSISIEHEGQTRFIRTKTLVVGNNLLQLEQLGIAEAPAVEQKQLVAIVLRSMSTLALYGLLIRSAFGQLSSANNVEIFPFERLTVRPHRRRRIKVAIDGEITRLKTPLVFQVASTPLRLLVPTHRSAPAETR